MNPQGIAESKTGVEETPVLLNQAEREKACAE